MTGHVKIAGAWKEVSNVSAKVGGAWKEVTNGFTKIAGVWKEWFSASDYKLIGSIANATGQSHSFTGIPQTYSHLFLDISAKRTGVDLLVTMNNLTNYDSHFFGLRNSAIHLENQTATTRDEARMRVTVGTNLSDVLVAQLYIPFYSSAESNIGLIGHAGGMFSDGTNYLLGASASFHRDPVTSIQLNLASENATDVDIKLFGIK